MLHLASFRKFSGVALAALALVLPAASRAQTGYTLIDLGALGGAYVSGSAISIQGCKNLRVVLPKQGIKGTATLPDVTLPAGNANNDNSVDATDFGAFVSACNSSASVPGSGYDPTCEFNFDGAVDPADFGLFVGNYNTAGAN